MPSANQTPLSSRRACIDVGTNSVKLLVADVAGAIVTPFLEQSRQTRLGRGFYETHRLQPEPIAQTAQAVAEFCRLARQSGASSVRVIGTSAVRDAINAEELVQAIFLDAGVKIETISGEQEADWAFRGVTTDPQLARRALLILDVGGGSTEFIVGRNLVPQFSQSFRLGSVRLLESLSLQDPPGMAALGQCRAQLERFFVQQVLPAVQPALAACGQPVELIGTGGTATILARMEASMEDFDRERIEATPITLEAIRRRQETCWQMTLAQRQSIVGLPAKRADVILAGMSIYEAIMERFHFRELRVSTRGLRFAALLSASESERIFLGESL